MSSAPNATRETYEDGSALLRWFADGVLHRLDGPAFIAYYSSGAVEEERYYVDGHLTRADGPAEISYYETGEKKGEVFFSPGRNYRIDGPTRVQYERDGSVFHQGYEFEQKGFVDLAALARYALLYNETSLRGEIEDSKFAPLLNEGVSGTRVFEVLAEGITTLDGVRQVLEGAPIAWARAFEDAEVSVS